MPTVPDLYPDVTPTTQGAPGINYAVPAEAFGGAIGHALVGLGGTLEQAGDRVWQRAVELQNLENETHAKNADALYMQQSGQLHADFLQKEGVNAGSQALAQHIQDLQKLRTDIRSDIANPMAQKMYDSSSVAFMGRNIFNAAGHSGQQMKVAASNASQARVDMMTNQIGENPGDDIGFQRATRATASEIDQQGALHGWSPDQIAATKQSTISSQVATRVAGLAKTDVTGAQDLLERASKQGLLLPGDEQKVRNTVQTQFRQVASRNISDEVNKDLLHPGDSDDTKSVEDRVDEGMAKAKAIAPDDEQLPDIVRNRILADYGRQKKIETDFVQQNVKTVGQALLKPNAEGLFPSTVEQLQGIDPAVGPALDNLAKYPQQTAAIYKQLERNARGVSQPTTPENLQVYHTYRGQAMAGSDDERAAFMSQNFATDSKLTNGQKNSLMGMQDSMRKQSQSDPRVGRALNILKPDIQAAGIDVRDKEDYYRFTGALADELEQFQQSHPGKMPSTDEVKTMGRQLMQTTGKSMGYIWNSQTPLYRTDVPDDDVQRIKADPAWARRSITPNDDLVRRIYVQEQFQKLYGGTAKKAIEPVSLYAGVNAPVSE